MNTKSYYEKFLNKSAIMFKDSQSCKLYFSANSGFDWGNSEKKWVKVVEVNDNNLVLDFYLEGKKNSQLTIPFEQLVISES